MTLHSARGKRRAAFARFKLKSHPIFCFGSGAAFRGIFTAETSSFLRNKSDEAGAMTIEAINPSLKPRNLGEATKVILNRGAASRNT